MDDVVEKIVEAEDANFTLFHFLNALNRDIEEIKMKTNEIQRDIDAQQNQASFDEKTSPRMLLETVQLNEPISNPKEIESAQETTETILEGLHQILHALPEKQRSLVHLQKEDITLEKVEQILGTIEKFIHENLQVNIHSTFPKRMFRFQKDSENGMLQNTITSTHFSIVPPSTHPDGLDSIDLELFDDDKPALGDVLRLKVAKAMACKSNPVSEGIKTAIQSSRKVF